MMIPPDVIDGANAVRDKFLESLRLLGEVPSFTALRAGSAELEADTAACEATAKSPRVRKAFSPRFHCAFVGSSGDGKTTILAEMFPSLEDRGWLEKDVTDTTSQALIIRPAEANAEHLAQVSVQSWNVEQITRLARAAEAENRRTNVAVGYFPDRIEIDGTQADFNPEDARQFRFEPRQVLTPMPTAYVLSPEEAADPNLIRALTVKQPSALAPVGPVLRFGDRSFNVLQLRAAIRAVDLSDDFQQIREWAGGGAEVAGQLVFVDTPGLQVSGSVKDEVLGPTLGKKNQQIIVEMLREDELDLIIHLVLIPNQSAFSSLWKAVAEQCPAELLADLADRLILAVNGTNLYLSNPDLRRKWEDSAVARREGDHFAVTIEDNVLNKMSERGTITPARICFLDSRRIVESSGDNYQDYYARQRPTLESWAAPGGAGHDTLDRLGIGDSFRDNVAALCDPEDRGQGYLVRQVIDLARQNGPKIFLRKNFIRNGLLASIRKLRTALTRHYDAEGHLNFEAIRDAVKGCLGFLDPADPSTIEEFARRKLDRLVEQSMPPTDGSADPKKWAGEAFITLGRKVYQTATKQSGVNKEASELFRHFFEERFNVWYRDWGYRSAEMPPPSADDTAPAALIAHTLKLHAREMLYQLLAESNARSSAAVGQRPEETERVRELMKTLEQAERSAEAMCRRLGVPTA